MGLIVDCSMLVQAISPHLCCNVRVHGGVRGWGGLINTPRAQVNTTNASSAIGFDIGRMCCPYGLAMVMVGLEAHGV